MHMPGCLRKWRLALHSAMVTCTCSSAHLLPHMHRTQPCRRCRTMLCPIGPGGMHAVKHMQRSWIPHLTRHRVYNLSIAQPGHTAAQS